MVAFVPGVAAHDDEDDVCHARADTFEDACNSTGDVFGLVSGCEDGIGVMVGDAGVCVYTGTTQSDCRHDLGDCLMDTLEEYVCFEYAEPRCD